MSEEKDPAPSREDRGTPGKDKDVDLHGILDSLVKKHGDTQAVALRLLDENHELRRKNADLRDAVPSSGSVVLSEAEADRWRSYQELGRPEDLRKVVREHSENSAKLAELEYESSIRSIARVAGYEPAVLARVAADVEFEIRDVKERDRSTGRETHSQRVFVKGEDERAEAVPIEEYAEAHWKEFLPALRPQQGEPPARPASTPTRDFRKAAPAATSRMGVDDPLVQERLQHGHYSKF